MTTMTISGARPHGLVLLQGGRGEHSGGLARGRIGIKVGPQLMAVNAGDLLDFDHSLGRNATPLVDGAMRDPKLLGDLQAKASPSVAKKLLNGSHNLPDSTTITDSASEMIGVLCGADFRIAPQRGMAKVRPRFKQGHPRHFCREWRKFRGYTLEKAAEIAGVTHGAISQLERGEVAYTQGMLEALAYAYNCEPGDLVALNPYVRKEPPSILDGLSASDRREAERFIQFLKQRAEEEHKAA